MTKASLSLSLAGLLAALAVPLLSGCVVALPKIPTVETPAPVRAEHNYTQNRVSRTCGVWYSRATNQLYLRGHDNGYCGPGSYVSFNVGPANAYVIDQVCDTKRNIHKLPMSVDEFRVECTYTGSIADPQRTYSTTPLVVQRPKP